MTSTNTDIIGERTALERLIYDLQYTVDTRKDDGWSGLDSIGQIGISIEYAELLIKHLESILAKYRILELAAEQYKNPLNVIEGDRSRMISSAKMIRSGRNLLYIDTVMSVDQAANLKAAMLLLDSAVNELERNDL